MAHVVQALGSGVRHTLSYRWTQFFIACLVFDVIGMVWPVLRVLVVSGIVRCYPIIYFSPKARNATLNYMRALPSVLQWIGTWHSLLHPSINPPPARVSHTNPLPSNQTNKPNSLGVLPHHRLRLRLRAPVLQH